MQCSWCVMEVVEKILPGPGNPVPAGMMLFQRERVEGLKKYVLFMGTKDMSGSNFSILVGTARGKKCI